MATITMNRDKYLKLLEYQRDYEVLKEALITEEAKVSALDAQLEQILRAMSDNFSPGNVYEDEELRDYAKYHLGMIGNKKIQEEHDEK